MANLQQNISAVIAQKKAGYFVILWRGKLSQKLAIKQLYLIKK